MTRKVFWFLRSYYEAAKELSKEEQAEFFMGICSYALDGIEPEIHGVAGAMFKLAKPNIETSLKRSDAGSKKQTRNKLVTNVEQNDNKTETNMEQADSNQVTNDEQNENALMSNEYMSNEVMNNELMSNDKEKVKKEKRHKYGEYQNVLLSDQDLEKLKTEFPFDWEHRIEKVSEYCASKGKAYKNYLATIRTWARHDAKSTAQDSYNKVLDILGEDDG